MSTSVYLSEQIIHYPGKDATYYGFCVSFSDCFDECYPFGTAERRDDWTRAVREAFPKLEDYDAGLAAAMTACAIWGPEHTRDGISWALHERYGEDSAEMEELATRFDPSGKPGDPLAPIPGEGA